MAKSEVSRREFMRAAGRGAAGLSVSFFLGSSCRKSRLHGGKPNVVLFLIDDLGWMDLGCYGSRYFDTPNIDRLARQGQMFTDAYAACAVCSPTRASVMTGRYPARLGITDWIRAGFQGGNVPPDGRNPRGFTGDKTRPLLTPENARWLELDEVTLAEALKAQGYSTCHIGKWHLGFESWYPEKQGFDVNLGGCDFGQPPSYFDPYANEQLEGIPGLPPRKAGEYLTDRESDEAVRFIAENTSRPFFLYMAHYAVHTPIQGKPDLVEKYRGRGSSSLRNAVYGAMVESVDQSVGRILTALDEHSLTENTLVIFTSDNGGLIGPTDNAPLREGKGYPYEGGIRVPLIVRWPERVAAGRICSVPVTSPDYFPTICRAAGAEIPSDREIDGTDLLPLLEGKGTPGREALFWHFPHYRRHTPTSRRGWIVPYSVVRRGDWKLIKRYESPTFELYNLREDLSEASDLAAANPERVQDLDELLVRWLERIDARMPRSNPEYDPELALRMEDERLRRMKEG